VAAKKKAPKPSEVLPILLADTKGVSVGDLAEHLIAAIGGVKAFAELYVREMKSPGVKGVARARMLDGVMRIVTAHSSLNKKLGDDEHGMTDAELAAEAKSLLERDGG
jgi:hypothetical protein